MGINGLLPYLKPIQKDRNISQYAGQTVAIDSYCWLHKAIYSCALDLATGVPTEKYITYCLKKIELLLHYRIRPVVIFDGGALPSKQKTENDRENSRAENRKKAIEYLQAGNTQMAQRKFGESIDVTPQLALNLYKALRDRYKIECIVGPYEADAQLAYLSKIGYVDVIITEDSDLLAFGAKKVFYKMDAYGNGKEIELEEVKTIRGDVSPEIWSHNIFLSACILAGCDYLSSIRGIGFKKAYKLMGEMRHYKSVLKHLKLEGKHVVPIEYENNFEKAYLTFRYQRVFCPLKKRLVSVNDLDLESMTAKKKPGANSFLDTPPDVDVILEDNLFSRLLEEGNTLDFLGPDKSVEMAQAIAYGVIDPTTNKPYLPDSNSASSFSQVLSWNSDGQDTALIPNLSSSRSALISDGGHLEEEFSNRRSFSQFNHNDNKTKFYKVAKPKLIGHRAKDDPQQKNIKEFFKGVSKDGDGNVGSKIRDFFKNKITKKDSMAPEDLEEKLAPAESLDPDEYESSGEEPIGNSNKENEESKVSGFGSFLKKPDSYLSDGNFFFSQSNDCLFRNSQNVRKAFKVPTAVRREDSLTQMEEEAPEKNLKRKYEESATSAFNEFAFKKIKKEVLTLENKKESVRIPQLKMTPHKPVVLDSIKDLECFAFGTAKKTEKHQEEEIQKKTVYKIHLSTLAPRNVVNIDMQSFGDRNREGTNFFQLNPIRKLQLKERLYSRHQPSTSHERPDLDNRISSLVSYMK